MKVNTRWHSARLRQDIQVVRWGFAGVPVLLFPTAGGDAEECERFLNALLSICTHPDVFTHAICMSGTFDLARFLPNAQSQDMHFI